MARQNVKATLYDIPTILEEKTFSPFVMRTRLALNYKRIPFDTIWVDFPDIEKMALSLGAPYTTIYPDGSKGYTVPILTFQHPNQELVVLTDSDRIAQYLDDTFPDPNRMLFPKDTLVFQHAFRQTIRRSLSRAFIKVNITSLLHALPPHTREWWIETRPRAFGRSYEYIAPNTPEKRAKAWENYFKVFDEIAECLDAAGKGNHRVSGGIVTYAEIELVAWLKTISFIGKDDGWKGLECRNEGRWAKLVEEPDYRVVTSTIATVTARL